MTQNDAGAEDRLRRLEEHAGFGEHAVEQLSAEIAELNKRLHALVSRIDRMEQLVQKSTQPSGGESDSVDGE